MCVCTSVSTALATRVARSSPPSGEQLGNLFFPSVLTWTEELTEEALHASSGSGVEACTAVVVFTGESFGWVGCDRLSSSSSSDVIVEGIIIGVRRA